MLRMSATETIVDFRITDTLPMLYRLGNLYLQTTP